MQLQIFRIHVLKNNLKQFKNEDDRIMVLKAQQVFKIQIF